MKKTQFFFDNRGFPNWGGGGGGPPLGNFSHIIPFFLTAFLMQIASIVFSVLVVSSASIVLIILTILPSLSRSNLSKMGCHSSTIIVELEPSDIEVIV